MATLGFGQDFLPGHITQYGGIQRELFVFRTSVVEHHDLGMKRSLASFTAATFFGNQLGA